ncbi:hypothetical protein ONZ45_g18199 [Pleurotus djamor]|nr:hypothetical protein ONZ45_g18199 [Pleurotus djamor]
MHASLSSLLLLFFSASSHAATISNELREEIVASTSCCQELLENLGSGKVVFPGSPGFQELTGSYYTAQNSGLISQCRIAAIDAQDVSEAVKIIAKNECKFSVRSAGSMPWAGAANIASPGIAIDLSRITGVSLSTDKTVASLGPGNHWGAVYDALDPHGVTVVGGRSNVVGVGGFILGGGFSHLSPEHGFASDNVVNYEVVLSDGRIINTNATATPDLFWGLKGGSTNLGIITRYDVKVYPLTPKWGGFRGYTVSNGPAIFDAMAQMLVKLRDDPRGGATVVWGYNEAFQNDTVFASYAYLDANVSQTDLFDDMLSVPFINGTDSIRGNTYQQSLSGEVDAAYPSGLRRIFSTLTLKVDVDIAVGIYEKCHELFAPLVGKPEVQWTAIFQPISLPHLQATANSGGSPLGLSPDDGDLILLNLNTVWASEADDSAMENAVQGVIDWATQEAKRRNVYHPWLYSNYALPGQQVYPSYGADNYLRLKGIQTLYDPENVFGRLWKGGFKM